jgi:hypothetical protein
MNHLYCDSTFANRRGHPLDRAMTHISHREHARHTGLKQVGRPLRRRFSARVANSGEVMAGKNEALLITSYARW